MTPRERVARSVGDACDICMINDYRPNSKETPCEDCYKRADMALWEVGKWVEERAGRHEDAMVTGISMRGAECRAIAAELRGKR